MTSPGQRWTRMTSHKMNLAEFCQELCWAHAARMTRQDVSMHCDVPDDLCFSLPRALVREILDAWIEEALSEMPAGGELDISVVLTAAGLEIEVADSRDTDIHETSAYWHRQMKITDGTIVADLVEADLHLETTLCPQGGLARTVVIPPAAGATTAVRPRRNAA